MHANFDTTPEENVRVGIDIESDLFKTSRPLATVQSGWTPSSEGMWWKLGRTFFILSRGWIKESNGQSISVLTK